MASLFPIQLLKSGRFDWKSIHHPEKPEPKKSDILPLSCRSAHRFHFIHMHLRPLLFEHRSAGSMHSHIILSISLSPHSQKWKFLLIAFWPENGRKISRTNHLPLSNSSTCEPRTNSLICGWFRITQEKSFEFQWQDPPAPRARLLLQLDARTAPPSTCFESATGRPSVSSYLMICNLDHCNLRQIISYHSWPVW